MRTEAQKNIRFQQILVTITVLLFVVKLLAWYLTGSVAILTDALESTVNVIAGFIGLYSLNLSSKPKDKEHPYGHGKVEFLSSAIEGLLIITAGFIIVYEAADNLIHPHELKSLDIGMALVMMTAIVNYVVGWYCVRQGKKSNSPVLIGSGEHLKSDTYSTFGILVGVALVYFTNIKWIDSAAAMLFAFIIIFTGYKIVRRAVSGIMDESDEKIINEIVDVLKNNRKAHWVDVHNMRVINYAGFYHIDCHLTVPFYINVHEAHDILDELTKQLTDYFKNRVEFFIHVDGCLPKQCSICEMKDCSERSSEFMHRIEWNYTNIISNEKHSANQRYSNN
jgi:cation diffusion facilitator family transporter